MKTVKVKVYSVTELTEQAQQKAYEHWAQSNDYPWADENRSTLNEFEKIFPIKVKNFEYGGGGSPFVNWEFQGDDNVEELTSHRLATYLWNNYRRQIFKGKYYGRLVDTFPNGNKIPVSKEHPIGQRHVLRYSKVIIENSCVLTGYGMDEDILQPMYKFIDKPDDRNFKDLIEDCLHSWATACDKDYDHCNSMEYFIDHAQGNDYEFTEDGERF